MNNGDGMCSSQNASIGCGGGYCDYVLEQIPLTVTWGKKFLLVPFPEPSIKHSTKIVASEGETTITQTCNNTYINSIFLNTPCDWNLKNTYIDPFTYCTIESDSQYLYLNLFQKVMQEAPIVTIHSYMKP